jgi:hypothetical protein
MLMCHMLADTDEELFEMVDKIGVRRKWHQAPPKHDSHFDISKGKRELAVKAGAVQITLRQCAAMNFRRRVTGELGSPADAWEWMRNYKLKGNGVPEDATRTDPTGGV